MKNIHSWLHEYGESHQNKTNISIHLVCVPAIFFSVIGLLYCIPLFEIISSPITLAHIVALFAVTYYLLLSIKLGAVLTIFTILSLRIWTFLDRNDYPVFYIGLTIFVIAWIGQFIGHKIEGKKPSFFQDLQFLLIGPLWTASHFIKP